MKIPSAYTEGYARARSVDQAAADNYIKHTTIGDPELDPIMEELSSLPPADLHRFIGAGIEGQSEVLLGAPQVLREFSVRLIRLPPGSTMRPFAQGSALFT